MSAKTSARRRAAFMAALRATGNQSLAAERAKVSQSWVTLHRANDPDFRRESDVAIAEARAGFDALRTSGSGGSTKPPSGWGSLDGEELVVRGSNGRRTQIARARLRQWSPRVEARFLTALSAICNVKAACAEVGLTPASAYNHRKRWPGFAAKWDEAVKDGYGRIEAGLIESACNFLSGREVEHREAAPPMTGMSVAHAIHLLHMHKCRVHRIGREPGRMPRLPDPEAVRASIMRKIEAILRADALDPKVRARDEREWAARRGPSTLRQAQGEREG